jgi:hypothetical protein
LWVMQKSCHTNWPPHTNWQPANGCCTSMEGAAGRSHACRLSLLPFTVLILLSACLPAVLALPVAIDTAWTCQDCWTLLTARTAGPCEERPAAVGPLVQLAPQVLRQPVLQGHCRQLLLHLPQQTISDSPGPGAKGEMSTFADINCMKNYLLQQHLPDLRYHLLQNMLIRHLLH